jgi:hypothetical protein
VSRWAAAERRELTIDDPPEAYPQYVQRAGGQPQVHKVNGELVLYFELRGTQPIITGRALAPIPPDATAELWVLPVDADELQQLEPPWRIIYHGMLALDDQTPIGNVPDS